MLAITRSGNLWGRADGATGATSEVVRYQLALRPAAIANQWDPKSMAIKERGKG